MKKIMKILLVCGAVLLLCTVRGEAKPQTKERVFSQVCLGTRFASPTDKWAGNHFVCTGKYVKTPGVRGVAHRWLPCFTQVKITNLRTGKTTTAPVLDRGPYLAIMPRGSKCPKEAKGRCMSFGKSRPGRFWYIKMRYRWPGKWAGCLDMTPPVTRAIGHNGWEKVKIEYTLPPRK